MRILFDQGTPWPLRRFLNDHETTSLAFLSWQALQNGVLLAKAESSGYEVLVTTDQNMRHQQSMNARRLGIVVLWTTDWISLRAHGLMIADRVLGCQAGEVVVINRPAC